MADTEPESHGRHVVYCGGRFPPGPVCGPSPSHFPESSAELRTMG